MYIKNFRRPRSTDIIITTADRLTTQKYDHHNKGSVYISVIGSSGEGAAEAHTAVDDANTHKWATQDQVDNGTLGEAGGSALADITLSGSLGGTPDGGTDIGVGNMGAYASCLPVYFTWIHIDTGTEYTGENPSFNYPPMGTTASYKVRASSGSCVSYSPWKYFDLVGNQASNLDVTGAVMGTADPAGGGLGGGCDDTDLFKGVAGNLIMFAGTSSDGTVTIDPPAFDISGVTYGNITDDGGGYFTIANVVVPTNATESELVVTITSKLIGSSTEADWNATILLLVDGEIDANVAANIFTIQPTTGPLGVIWYNSEHDWSIQPEYVGGPTPERDWMYQVVITQGDGETAPHLVLADQPYLSIGPSFTFNSGLSNTGTHITVHIRLTLERCESKTKTLTPLVILPVDQPMAYTINNANLATTTTGIGPNSDVYIEDNAFSMMVHGSQAVPGNSNSPASAMEYIVTPMYGAVLEIGGSDITVGTVFDENEVFSVRKATGTEVVVRIVPRVKLSPNFISGALVDTTTQSAPPIVDYIGYTIYMEGESPSNNTIFNGSSTLYKVNEIRENGVIIPWAYTAHMRWTRNSGTSSGIDEPNATDDLPTNATLPERVYDMISDNGEASLVTRTWIEFQDFPQLSHLASVALYKPLTAPPIAAAYTIDNSGYTRTDNGDGPNNDYFGDGIPFTIKAEGSSAIPGNGNSPATSVEYTFTPASGTEIKVSGSWVSTPHTFAEGEDVFVRNISGNSVELTIVPRVTTLTSVTGPTDTVVIPVQAPPLADAVDIAVWEQGGDETSFDVMDGNVMMYKVSGFSEMGTNNTWAYTAHLDWTRGDGDDVDATHPNATHAPTNAGLAPVSHDMVNPSGDDYISSRVWIQYIDYPTLSHEVDIVLHLPLLDIGSAVFTLPALIDTNYLSFVRTSPCTSLTNANGDAYTERNANFTLTYTHAPVPGNDGSTSELQVEYDLSDGWNGIAGYTRVSGGVHQGGHKWIVQSGEVFTLQGTDAVNNTMRSNVQAVDDPTQAVGWMGHTYVLATACEVPAGPYIAPLVGHMHTHSGFKDLRDVNTKLVDLTVFTIGSRYNVGAVNNLGEVAPLRNLFAVEDAGMAEVPSSALVGRIGASNEFGVYQTSRAADLHFRASSVGEFQVRLYTQATVYSGLTHMSSQYSSHTIRVVDPVPFDHRFQHVLVPMTASPCNRPALEFDFLVMANADHQLDSNCYLLWDDQAGNMMDLSNTGNYITSTKIHAQQDYIWYCTDPSLTPYVDTSEFVWNWTPNQHSNHRWMKPGGGQEYISLDQMSMSVTTVTAGTDPMIMQEKVITPGVGTSNIIEIQERWPINTGMTATGVPTTKTGGSSISFTFTEPTMPVPTGGNRLGRVYYLDDHSNTLTANCGAVLSATGGNVIADHDIQRIPPGATVTLSVPTVSANITIFFEWGYFNTQNDTYKGKCNNITRNINWTV